METRASYILVGSFVLALIAAMLGIAVWFSKIQFDEAPLRYRVYFTGDVTGLNVGSPVRYRGVPVGSVADIRIDPENVERTRVLVDVQRGTPVKADTIARISLQGITGVAFIQLAGGTRDAAALAPKDRHDQPVIRSEPSTLQRIVTRLPEIIDRAAVVADRLAQVFDERNRDALSAMIRNLGQISEALNAEKANLKDTLAEGRKTLAALTTVLQNLDTRTATLATRTESSIKDFRGTLDQVRAAADNFSDVAEQLKQMVAENRTPLRDFSEQGLYELSQFIAEARVLVDSLTRLTREIERDPSRFLFGDTQKGFKPQ
jgi:phospholipid/cholesterol/gamma-HCH transport system substrate-binding protein